MPQMPALKSVLIKAGIVAAVGGAGSMLFLGGGRSVHIMGGAMAPMFVATAASLAASSVAAAYIVPYATQAMLRVSPGSTLSKIENMLIEPLLVGAVAVGVEAILSPDTMKDTSGIIGVVGLGIASQVGASYISEGSGLTATVLG